MFGISLDIFYYATDGRFSGACFAVLDHKTELPLR